MKKARRGGANHPADLEDLRADIRPRGDQQADGLRAGYTPAQEERNVKIRFYGGPRHGEIIEMPEDTREFVVAQAVPGQIIAIADGDQPMLVNRGRYQRELRRAEEPKTVTHLFAPFVWMGWDRAGR